MGWKTILSLVSVLFLVSLLIFYFLPLNTINFNAKTGNYNFSTSNKSSMQFYPNMRFSSNDISYKISDCPLQKQNDMEYAFNIIANQTPLVFYPVESNEQISVTCQDRNIVDNGMFIAGEGGPTNITVAGQFNVIMGGQILLIRPSSCEKPHIALHELLHVLGFEHSTNPENIMYNVTDCNQVIGDDMLQLINQLYSIPSLPDLVFENASAIMSGRFLSVNMTIINAGLNYAGQSKIDIYAGENIVKEIDLEPIKIGNGRIIEIENIFIAQISVNELKLIINSSFDEISKENNEIMLEIK